MTQLRRHITMRRSVYLLMVFAFLIIPILQIPTTTPTAHASEAAIYWGAYIKGNTYGYSDAPWDTRTIETFESHAGKKLSILHWGSPWYWGSRGGYMVFQRDMAEKVRLRGSIPMITWTSEDLSIGATKDQPDFQLGDVINGQHDAYIRQWARDAKAWGYPMFVRMNHEMNGTWYHWSEKRNGNSAGQYARMWQHVVTIFKQEGATNVTWVWAPNRVWPNAQPLTEVYPGDSYVDWVGMSGYNWGTNPAKPNNSWQNFDQVFKMGYDQLGTMAPSKPVMITETSSTEYGGSKAGWITEVLQKTVPTNYPRIKALVWFNWNHPATYGNMDWVIESSATAQAAFAASIASPYYATNVFGNLPLLSKVQPLSSAGLLAPATATATTTPSPTATTAVATATPSPTATTAVPTATPSPTATTAVTTATPSPTATTAVATATSSPTATTAVATATPSPTATTAVATATPSPTATTATVTTNVIQNPSFENTGSTPWYSPWGVRNDLGATFTQDGTTYAAGSKSLKVSLPKSSSTQPWVVQLRQPGKTITAGKTYTITFYAKASSSRSINVMLQQSASPYTEYFKQTPTLTSSWTKYTYTYTATTTSSSVSLNFNLAQTTGTVWIDNVSMS